MIYRVRNNGPQDLDALIVHRPRVPAGPRIPDGIKYPLAVTGGWTGWADDEIEFGRLPLGQVVDFTLCCGAEMKLRQFRVRIECLAGSDRWEMLVLLPAPR